MKLRIVVMYTPQTLACKGYHIRHANAELVSMAKKMPFSLFHNRGSHFTTYHFWTLAMCPRVLIKSCHCILCLTDNVNPGPSSSKLLEGKCRAMKIQLHQKESRSPLTISFQSQTIVFHPLQRSARTLTIIEEALAKYRKGGKLHFSIKDVVWWICR